MTRYPFPKLELEVRPRVRPPAGLTASTPEVLDTDRGFDFCITECLLGVQHKGKLDHNCPNMEFHRLSTGLENHQIGSADLVRMLKVQLDKNLEDYFQRMDRHDTIRDNRPAWAMPFKITLMPYGYTVVGKGSVQENWERGLRWEEKIYQTLQSIQGSAIPVFLGSMHLKEGYICEQKRINHFLLLSWAGDALNRQTMEGHHVSAFRTCLRRIRACGVDVGMHVPYANALWSEQRGSVQLIGFRSAQVVEAWQRLAKCKERGKEEAPEDWTLVDHGTQFSEY